DVLSAFHTQMGITFDSVEPLNEPTDPWVPGLNGGQEGMQVSRNSTSTSSNPQDSILSDLCVALSQAQLPVSVAAPDGFNPDGTSSFPVAPPDNTLADLNYYSQSTRNCLGQVDTHMYNLGIDFSLGWPPVKGDLGAYVGAGRVNVAAAAANLSPGAPPRLWMSEFGNGGDGRAATTATALSTQIARDIRDLRPSAWVYWQALAR